MSTQVQKRFLAALSNGAGTAEPKTLTDEDFLPENLGKLVSRDFPNLTRFIMRVGLGLEPDASDDEVSQEIQERQGVNHPGPSSSAPAQPSKPAKPEAADAGGAELSALRREADANEARLARAAQSFGITVEEYKSCARLNVSPAEYVRKKNLPMNMKVATAIDRDMAKQAAKGGRR